jgi:heme-degrading monooxygenase HmoA
MPRMALFDAARRSALMSDLLGHLLGRPADLLPFEQVREGLRLRHVVDRGIQEVPLDKVVGTLGREKEFNRAFLPRDESLRERWEGAERLAESQVGFPSVELYKVGDVYFVVDGHHRVSVAKQMEQASIEAWVKEFLTPVPVEANESIDEIVLKSGYADFLEATGLKPEDPDEFAVTTPSGYERLLEHISVHRWYKGVEWKRPVSWDEAVASWRDTVYRPMIGTIKQSCVMDDFPDATPADLYLFTMAHLHNLRERYGDQVVTPEKAMRHLKLSLKWRGRKKKVGG